MSCIRTKKFGTCPETFVDVTVIIVFSGVASFRIVEADIRVAFHIGEGLTGGFKGLCGECSIKRSIHSGGQCHGGCKICSCHGGNGIDQEGEFVLLRHQEVRMDKGGQLVINAAIVCLHFQHPF